VEDNKKKILEDLEAGKLTSEQAFEALNSLEANNYESNQKQYSQESVVSLVGRVFDNVVNKVKELDIDLNFGESTFIVREYSFAESIDHLLFEVKNGSIIVEPTDENEVKLICTAHVYGEKSESSAKLKFDQSFHSEIKNGRLHLTLKERKIKGSFTLKLPKKQYENIKVKTGNGGIECKDLHVIDFEGKTTNGPIHVTNSYVEQVEVETLNGRVVVEACNGKKCEIETLNGAVKLQSVFNKSDIQTTNGKIEFILDDHLHGEVNLKTEAGEITAKLPYELKVIGEVKTNFGGIDCQFDNLQILNEKKEVVSKEVRFIANSDKEDVLQICAESTAGSVSLTHKE
jgi:DUF4097 and DUF4098 domain-containing protein YvlB